ncbi:MAG: SGNH/GDSL hydrolase family protein [Pseudomonadota bacterium]
MRRLLIAFALFVFTIPAAAQDGPRNILVLGDSMLAWNKVRGSTIAQNLAKELNANILDQSVSGEVIGSGGAGGIFGQYRAGDWDWIVMNGGGNDFLKTCRCSLCDPILNRLISKNGQSGIIPAEIRKLRKRGHKVLYMGYLRANGFYSPVSQCSKYADALEDRIARLADFTDGMSFLYNKNLVPTGDRSFHAFDRVHPSVKGSRAIAKGVADALTRSETGAASVFSNGG